MDGNGDYSDLITFRLDGSEVPSIPVAYPFVSLVSREFVLGYPSVTITSSSAAVSVGVGAFDPSGAAAQAALLLPQSGPLAEPVPRLGRLELLPGPAGLLPLGRPSVPLRPGSTPPPLPTWSGDRSASAAPSPDGLPLRPRPHYRRAQLPSTVVPSSGGVGGLIRSTVVTADQATRQAVADWHYWLRMGYSFWRNHSGN